MWSRLLSVFLLSFLAIGTAQAGSQVSDTTISTSQGSLYLLHRSPDQGPDKGVVLFLESYAVPTAAAFDVPGYSWMEHLAERHYDCWAMDFRGFGHSSRPVAMDRPPQENRPVIRSADALADVAEAMAYISEQTHAKKITLIGWSYGSVIAAMFAADHPELVDKVVLLGSMRAFPLPSMTMPLEAKDQPGVLNPALPAYQTVTPKAALNHWHMMEEGLGVVSEETFAKIEEVVASSDPAASGQASPVIRRPIGPLVDLYEIWSNRPIYDAAKMRVPVLVVRGQQDHFAEKGLAGKFVNSPNASEIEIPNATHWVLYETGQGALWAATDRFLSESVVKP